MWNNEKRELIYNQAVEFSFDCELAYHTFPKGSGRILAQQLKRIVEQFIGQVMKDLQMGGLHPYRPPYFEKAKANLFDIFDQLKLAKGLGFLDVDGFRVLQRRGNLLWVLLDDDTNNPAAKAA